MAPLMPPALMACLDDLNERLTGTPSASPARVLGSRKSKATVGSWLENRLTKFIAGEEDGTAPAKEVAPPKGKDAEGATAIGPFSHFSTISPSPSASVTRTTSTADVKTLSMGSIPESEENSPTKNTSQWGEPDSIGNGYGVSAGSSGWQPWSAAPSNTNAQDDMAADESADTTDAEGGEFINPMGGLSFGSAAATPAAVPDYNPPKRVDLGDEEDEDLGFGNSSLSRARTPRQPDTPDAKDDTQSNSKSKTAAAPAAPPPEEKKDDSKRECLMEARHASTTDIQLPKSHGLASCGAREKEAQSRPN